MHFEKSTVVVSVKFEGKKRTTVHTVQANCGATAFPVRPHGAWTSPPWLGNNSDEHVRRTLPLYRPFIPEAGYPLSTPEQAS